jgi:hypothetical protein
MKLYLLLIVNLFLLISCKKYKPAEPAFFIRANPVTVKTINNQTIRQGTGSHKITDLFLYVNGKFQGAYPTGNLMPVISKNEPVTINIFAGIKNNGISETRITWNFYQYTTLDTAVESGKTIDYPLTFQYNPNVKFEWMEDFDSGNGYTIKKSATSQVNFRLAPVSESFEGRSMLLELTGDSAEAQVESTIAHTLPASTSDIYLEINYKCTAPFKVGIFASGEAPREAVVVNPQPNWNKIYIQMAGVVNSPPRMGTSQVYFRMVKTDDYPNPKLYLDNIKLIHF